MSTSSDDDASFNSIMNIRIPTDLRQEFKAFCDENSTTPSQAIRTMIKWTLVHQKLPTVDADMDPTTPMSDEEMVVAIAKRLPACDGDLDKVVELLTQSKSVSERFVNHCIGKMILAGALNIMKK